MKYLAIIPAYNEGANIYDVVKNIKNSNFEFDIVVINDGSQDNTYSEAKRAGAKVINLSNNLGIGGAVQTGYLFAYNNNYDAAIQIDGDGQHDSKELNKLVEELEKNEAELESGFAGL